jgi:hypothetical protein
MIMRLVGDSVASINMLYHPFKNLLMMHIPMDNPSRESHHIQIIHHESLAVETPLER